MTSSAILEKQPFLVNRRVAQALQWERIGGTAMETAKPVTRSDIEQHRHIVDAAVARVCRRIPLGAAPRQDLEAAALCGLVDALNRKGSRTPEEFEWYARVRVRGAIMDELRKRDWAPRRVRARIRREREEGTGGSEPFVVMLDSEAVDRLPAQNGGQSPLELYEERSERLALRRAIARLSERDGTVLRMHYLDSIPFKDIAAKLNVTQARVSQLHTRALHALRGILRKEARVA